MIKPVRQILAMVAALALTAAPAASCGPGFAGLGHAAATEAAAPSAHASGDSRHDRCSDGERAPAPDHDRTCGKCSGHGGGQCVAANLTDTSPGLLTQIAAASPAVAASWRPDFTPALLRIFAPPHGPPLAHRTPVSLNTMLRL